MKKQWLILFCVIAYPAAFAAEVYQWRDASGQLHFSDQKPSNIAVEKKQYKAADGYSLVNEELSSVLLKAERRAGDGETFEHAKPRSEDNKGEVPQ